ncbi:hypothetical protein, partial [Actinotalea ferrariae]|uniref:hypothetical protein n=1 Tax=Actinotalea ferrariae TaxID=1386098 RepID=UPI000551A3E1
RDGVLPALRLPWPGPLPATPSAPGLLDDHGRPAGTWATVVVLVLRDAAAVATVREQLDAVGDPLLLALPGLDDVVV